MHRAGARRHGVEPDRAAHRVCPISVRSIGIRITVIIALPVAIDGGGRIRHPGKLRYGSFVHMKFV
ncbi:hypothetical protein GCM10011404_15940 [Sphingomonas prati]|nr:hypothetical protein GCM10011404_15940 [Sphingomonas prati]